MVLGDIHYRLTYLHYQIKVMKYLVLPLLAFALNASAIEHLDRPYLPTAAKPAASSSVTVSPVISQKVTKTWSMDARDVNYAGAFHRWAKEANYQVRWDAGKHFLVDAKTTFAGSFEEAVSAALSNPGVAASSYPLEVCFYPNTPPLARISRKGDQDNECK